MTETMTPDKLVQIIRSEVIEGQTESDRETYLNLQVNSDSSAYWKNVSALFSSLSLEQRETLFSVMRQVSLDTTCSLLAILDGVRMIEGIYDDFVLTYSDGEVELNGDLASLLLELEELERDP